MKKRRPHLQKQEWHLLTILHSRITYPSASEYSQRACEPAQGQSTCWQGHSIWKLPHQLRYPKLLHMGHRLQKSFCSDLRAWMSPLCSDTVHPAQINDQPANTVQLTKAAQSLLKTTSKKPSCRGNCQKGDGHLNRCKRISAQVVLRQSQSSVMDHRSKSCSKFLHRTYCSESTSSCFRVCTLLHRNDINSLPNKLQLNLSSMGSNNQWGATIQMAFSSSDMLRLVWARALREEKHLAARIWMLDS